MPCKIPFYLGNVLLRGSCRPFWLAKSPFGHAGINVGIEHNPGRLLPQDNGCARYALLLVVPAWRLSVPDLSFIEDFGPEPAKQPRGKSKPVNPIQPGYLVWDCSP